MFEDSTASEIASALDRVRYISPEYTGPLSILDEAVLGWTLAYPQLIRAHREFADARYQMWPDKRTDASVLRMHAAATTLADQMKSLGDVRLTLCQEQTRFGTCKAPIVDGTCVHRHAHTGPATSGAGNPASGDPE